MPPGSSFVFLLWSTVKVTKKKLLGPLKQAQQEPGSSLKPWGMSGPSGLLRVLRLLLKTSHGSPVGPACSFSLEHP